MAQLVTTELNSGLLTVLFQPELNSGHTEGPTMLIEEEARTFALGPVLEPILNVMDNLGCQPDYSFFVSFTVNA